MKLLKQSIIAMMIAEVLAIALSWRISDTTHLIGGATEIDATEKTDPLLNTPTTDQLKTLLTHGQGNR